MSDYYELGLRLGLVKKAEDPSIISKPKEVKWAITKPTNRDKPKEVKWAITKPTNRDKPKLNMWQRNPNLKSKLSTKQTSFLSEIQSMLKDRKSKPAPPSKLNKSKWKPPMFGSQPDYMKLLRQPKLKMMQRNPNFGVKSPKDRAAEAKLNKPMKKVTDPAERKRLENYFKYSR
jgi:hypothetical protein